MSTAVSRRALSKDNGEFVSINGELVSINGELFFQSLCSNCFLALPSHFICISTTTKNGSSLLYIIEGPNNWEIFVSVLLIRISGHDKI